MKGYRGVVAAGGDALPVALEWPPVGLGAKEARRAIGARFRAWAAVALTLESLVAASERVP
jgi:hypothetical protein